MGVVAAATPLVLVNALSIGSLPFVLVAAALLVSATAATVVYRNSMILAARVEALDKASVAWGKEQDLLRAANASLEWRANHDHLTGVGNRQLLAAELDEAIALSFGQGHQVGLLFVDLDRFKSINDAHGHPVGDALLVAVCGRLKGAIADTDSLIARVGGDEFVVMFPRLESPALLDLVSTRIVQAFETSYSVGNIQLDLGVSLGMALSEPGDTPGDLYQAADSALYLAKQQGRGKAAWARPIVRLDKPGLSPGLGRQVLWPGGQMGPGVIEIPC